METIDPDLLNDLFVHQREAYFEFLPNPKQGWVSRRENLTSEKLLQHIKGDIRLGVCATKPETQTCIWVAADFDDHQDAFSHALKLKHELKQNDIPCFIERSYSGKGYHLFVFFKDPILASRARRMMMGALHKARIPTKGKFQKGGNAERSIDRLFPSQDTVRSNGLGSQIAMPLYGKAVPSGNNVFIDDHGKPYAKQWELLREIYDQRLDIQHPKIDELIKYADQEIHSYSLPTQENGYGDYLNALANLDGQFDRFYECEAIQQSFKNPNQFNNFTWMGILSNIAVWGQNGLELAHEVSRGYDMSAIKNDPTAIYTEEETSRVYRYKIDHIQMGGFPVSCKRLAEEGWECPKLKAKQCHAGFPAKYGAPPSFMVYHQERPLTTEERLEIHNYEKSRLYDRYREWFSADKQDMSDMDILTHLLGYRKLIVDLDQEKPTSFCLQFHNQNDAMKFTKFAKENHIPCNLSEKRVWLLRKKQTNIEILVASCQELLRKSGLHPQVSASTQLRSHFKHTAPFFGQLQECSKFWRV